MSWRNARPNKKINIEIMKILRVIIYFLLFTTITYGQQKSTTALKSIKANINNIKNSEKKWDGTIKNLFEGNYEDIVVSNNDGVKKIIETINKQGKSKATKENYDNKVYLKVLTPKEEKFVTDFYPIQNLDNFTVIRSNGMACIGGCSSGCNIVGDNCICYPVNKPLPKKCKYLISLLYLVI